MWLLTDAVYCLVFAVCCCSVLLRLVFGIAAGVAGVARCCRCCLSCVGVCCRLRMLLCAAIGCYCWCCLVSL